MSSQEPEIDHGQLLEVLDRDECVELLRTARSSAGLASSSTDVLWCSR